MTPDVMRMSKLYAPTLEGRPVGRRHRIVARLLLRAGMMRKAASGLYTFLPLGFRVLTKVEQHRARGNGRFGRPGDSHAGAAAGGAVATRAAAWDDYGPELMRLTDRHDREICLGPTHEELIAALVRNELRSYKELPLNALPDPDEVPRRDPPALRSFALPRVHHEGRLQLPRHPGVAAGRPTTPWATAYGAHLRPRCGLDYRAVEADAGQIGGKRDLTEFMALAEAGEADLVHCSCGYAADAEAGDVSGPPHRSTTCRAMEKIATPGVHTIAELAEFLEHPRVVHGEGALGQGRRGQPGGACSFRAITS